MVWGQVFKLYALIPHQTSHVPHGSFHCMLLGHKLMGRVSKGNVYKLRLTGGLYASLGVLVI
jgi:hypothetical protein